MKQDVKQESVNVEILEALVHIMEYNPMATIGDITYRGMFGVMHQQALVCVTTQVQMNKPPALMKISFVPKRDASVPNLIKDMSLMEMDKEHVGWEVMLVTIADQIRSVCVTVSKRSPMFIY